MTVWEYLEFETEYYQVERINGKTQSEKKFVWKYLSDVELESWKIVSLICDIAHHMRAYLAKRENKHTQQEQN
jgi:hypothetical protein